MNTLTFPIEQAKYNTAIEAGQPPRNPYELHAYSRLSTFHMPRGVAISWTDKDQCKFRFIYPNDETSERSVRTIEADTSVHVLLGKHSRKILCLVFDGAHERLANGPVRFDPAAAHAWVEGLPSDAVFATCRNAEVIAAILAAMPDDTRAQVLKEDPNSVSAA